MRFTILGGSGFIGGALTHRLQAEGHECCTPLHTSLPPCAGETPCMGHVLYCIGLTADFRSRPFDTARAHVSHLIPWLEHGNFESFLYLSSTRVYVRSTSTHEGAPVIAHPDEPDDLYQLTKAAGESICLSLQDARVRVVRLSTVVGRRADTHDFVNGLLAEGARSRRVELQSHLDCAKDYVRLEDVTMLLPRIAVSGARRLYNVASGVNLTHASVCAAIAEATGWELSVHPNARSSKFLPIDITRVQKEFGFKPKEVLPAIREMARHQAQNSPTIYAQ